MESKNISKEIIEAYEKYAPKNISLEQFAQMIEQDPKLLTDIGGEFSTFDAELARAIKPIGPFTSNTSAKADNARTVLHETLRKNADSMASRMKEITKIYQEIICSNDDILTAAWTFELLDEKQKLKLAVDIVNAMNNYYNIDEKVETKYNDKYIYNSDFLGRVSIPKDVPNFVNKFFKTFFSTVGGYYDDSDKKILLAAVDTFPKFLGILAHEYGHFIDRRFPDKGMLGAQIANAGFFVYGTDYGRSYNKEEEIRNPSEISSYSIEYDIIDNITNILQEQKEKKPALYINALQQAIDKFKIRFKALAFKEKKAWQQYTELKDKIIYKKYPDFDNLPINEQQDIIHEIGKNIPLKILRQRYKSVNSQFLDKYYRTLRAFEKHLAYFKSEHESATYESSDNSR